MFTTRASCSTRPSRAIRSTTTSSPARACPAAGALPGGGRRRWPSSSATTCVVNGMIWPKADVEPRNYRMRLLNGTDSASWCCASARCRTARPICPAPARRCRSMSSAATRAWRRARRRPTRWCSSRAAATTSCSTSRRCRRQPGHHGEHRRRCALRRRLRRRWPEDFFPDRQTDRIMAFDVTLPLDTASRTPSTRRPSAVRGNPNPSTRRKVALFEGTDEFGRLQPLLGTAEPTMDARRQRRQRRDRLAQPDDRESRPRRHRDLGDLQRHRRRPSRPPAPGELRES